MKFWCTRTVAAMVMAISVGCSGGSIGPLAFQPSAMVPSIAAPKIYAAALSANARSACYLKDDWNLHGSCTTYKTLPTHTTVKFDTYENITLTMTWSADEPPLSGNSWLAADAVGGSDITGIYKGKRFPVYGSTKCVDYAFRTITCPGTAFLYAVVSNRTSHGIGFQHTPGATIVDSGSYPGTKCYIANLEKVYGWEWQLLQLRRAIPVGDTLQFPHGPQHMVFDSDSVAYFAFICE